MTVHKWDDLKRERISEEILLVSLERKFNSRRRLDAATASP